MEDKRDVLAWIKFEDGAITDYSSYSNSYSLNGNVSATTGQFGDAGFFDVDQDSYFNLTGVPTFDDEDSITISFWLNVAQNDSRPYGNPFISCQDDGFGYGFAIVEQDGEIGISIAVALDTPVTLNQWQHHVYTLHAHGAPD